MQLLTILIAISILFVTGCSTSGSSNQNLHATKVVEQVDQSVVERPDIQSLNSSFDEQNNASPFSGSVVELTGEVVAFALTEDDLYTVTIRDNNSNVVCVFNNSISGKLGDGREVHDGAIITVRGQCFSSGLFSSHSFSLDGCRIVSN